MTESQSGVTDDRATVDVAPSASTRRDVDAQGEADPRPTRGADTEERAVLEEQRDVSVVPDPLPDGVFVR